MTAVQWLIDELGEYFPDYVGGIELVVSKALAMEKEQIIESYLSGTAQFSNDARIDYPLTPEQYYTETYNTNT